MIMSPNRKLESNATLSTSELTQERQAVCMCDIGFVAVNGVDSKKLSMLESSVWLDISVEIPAIMWNNNTCPDQR